jgi:hypothetical protein
MAIRAEPRQLATPLRGVGQPRREREGYERRPVTDGPTTEMGGGLPADSAGYRLATRGWRAATARMRHAKDVAAPSGFGGPGTLLSRSLSSARAFELSGDLLFEP